MDDLSKCIGALMIELPFILFLYYYHEKHEIRGRSTKQVFLSKTKRKILLMSDWDKPEKLDVLYRAICLTPYIILLAMFYILGAIYMILDISGIHHRVLCYIMYFICSVSVFYHYAAFPLFYLIKFLIRKKI